MSAEARRMPKQKRALEKYHAVLGASVRVLMREGYEATNTSKIAREAGVAVGSLYEYFPNRESIFSAYLDERIASLLELINQRALDTKRNSNIKPEDNLRDWLGLAFEASHQNRDMLRVIVSEVPGALDLLSLKDLEEKLLPMAKVLAAGSSLSEEQIQIKTYVLSNALYGFIIRSFFSELPAKPDQIVEELLQLMLSYARYDG
jgi:AcrR family transcriptional regulator